MYPHHNVLTNYRFCGIHPPRGENLPLLGSCVVGQSMKQQIEHTQQYVCLGSFSHMPFILLAFFAHSLSRFYVRGEGWSWMHSLCICWLPSGPSCGSSLQQEDSLLLRTLLLSSFGHCSYHVPRRYHFLWEGPVGTMHVPFLQVS